MKTEKTLPDPNYTLSLFPNKADLVFFLTSNFSNPSIELYVNALDEVKGFICVSDEGHIYTTFKAPATTKMINNMEHITKGRLELIGILRQKIATIEKWNFYLKVGFIFFMMLSIWLFVQHGRQRSFIQKTIQAEAPKLIQDTII